MSAKPKMAPSRPWMELEPPQTRTLKVYALDPSAGNYIGNVMSINIKWEESLLPGPAGHKIAVIDYDGKPTAGSLTISTVPAQQFGGRPPYYLDLNPGRQLQFLGPVRDNGTYELKLETGFGRLQYANVAG